MVITIILQNLREEDRGVLAQTSNSLCSAKLVQRDELLCLALVCAECRYRERVRVTGSRDRTGIEANHRYRTASRYSETGGRSGRQAALSHLLPPPPSDTYQVAFLSVPTAARPERLDGRTQTVRNSVLLYTCMHTCYSLGSRI